MTSMTLDAGSHAQALDHHRESRPIGSQTQYPTPTAAPPAAPTLTIADVMAMLDAQQIDGVQATELLGELQAATVAVAVAAAPKSSGSVPFTCIAVQPAPAGSLTPSGKKRDNAVKGGSLQLRGIKGANVRYGWLVSASTINDLLADECAKLRQTVAVMDKQRNALRWSKDGAIGEGIPSTLDANVAAFNATFND